jgi:hypothetical protein
MPKRFSDDQVPGVLLGMEGVVLRAIGGYLAGSKAAIASREDRAGLRRARRTHECASDEHGRRQPLRTRRQDPPDFRHGDPTVNLYDWYVCIRNNPRRAVLADHCKRRGLLT